MKFSVLLVGLFAFTAMAQKQFSGVVKNQATNQLLVKAYVQIVETGESSYTDEKGQFVFKGNFPVLQRDMNNFAISIGRRPSLFRKSGIFSRPIT